MCSRPRKPAAEPEAQRRPTVSGSKKNGSVVQPKLFERFASSVYFEPFHR
jgi:hypothetical protein